MIDDEESEDFIDFSEAGIERERHRWQLVREEHVDLYLLWRSMSGMGGEGISGLWALANQPGSGALLKDFYTISAREKRLKRGRKFLKEGGKK